MTSGYSEREISRRIRQTDPTLKNKTIERCIRVYRLLQKNGFVSTSDISRELKVNGNIALKIARLLKSSGLADFYMFPLGMSNYGLRTCYLVLPSKDAKDSFSTHLLQIRRNILDKAKRRRRAKVKRASIGGI